MRFDIRKLALLLWLAAPAAQAQLWLGPAAVEVRAEDGKGHALSGAQVLLQYTSVNPKDGPAPVPTDSRGHADVGGLAEGAWHLEVSHDGFMTYMAEITVRRGRPEVTEATQFRVAGGGTGLMRVKVSRGSATAAPQPQRAAVVPAAPMAPPAPAAPAPRPEPAPTPAPAPRPIPQPETPPAPSAPRPAPMAQPVERPQAQPVPTPAPPPTVQPEPAPTRTPPVQTPQPRPEPPAPPVPAPRPTPPPPAPAPTPTPAPPPPPPVAAAPSAPIAPAADSTRLRTAKDRTCFECKPGESALSTEKVIPPGGGAGCGDLAARLRGGDVPADLPAGCRVLRLVLPAGMRYTGYRYEIQDQGKSTDCTAGQDCPQGTGRWPVTPILVRNPSGTVVLAPFELGPADRERRAVLTAYFSSGKK